MPNPLSSHEHGHRTVEFEFDHLAGRRVGVSPQVSYKPPGLTDFSCPGSVAHTGRTFDVLVGSHVIDKRNKTMIQDGKISAEDLLSLWNSRSLSFHTGGQVKVRLFRKGRISGLAMSAPWMALTSTGSEKRLFPTQSKAHRGARPSSMDSIHSRSSRLP